MKRLIIIVTTVLLFVSAVVFYFYNTTTALSTDPLDAIPADAALVFECTSGNDAMEEIRHGLFWKVLQKDSSFSRIESQMRAIDSISHLQPELGSIWTQKQLYVSLHLIKANTFDYLYATALPEDLRKGRAINLLGEFAGNRYTLDEREYEDVSIFEFRSGGSTVFSFAVSKGIILASKTSFLVEDAIRQLNNGLSIRKS
ncbi:MAG TPA: hypothetical protein PLU53_02005, partial [Bacteroidia bacterium]|nr:hypothetical protein [Bacteroidia bacterium]